MGELMRRYGVPALLSQELPEPDCLPLRVRLLSEDLVAFRDSSFQDQDMAITESMGGVFDRTKEHLGTADTQLIQQRAS